MADPEHHVSDIALADAESAMHKGRAGSLVAMGALGLAIVVGLVLLVGGEDEARVYGDLGRAINGLERASFDRFWGCALQGENVADLKNSLDLITKVDARGLERGRNYGLHVRDKCLPLLKDIGPQLDTLIVPEDLRPAVTAMKTSNNALRGAFSDYVAYLDDPELDYDQAIAKPHVTGIARGWYGFRKAHADANKLIKTKLK
jgi:hypothetical protein